jgi:hypothetical protein
LLDQTNEGLITYKIPKQIDSGDAEAQMLMALGDSASSSSQSIIITNMLLNLFMGGSLAQIWSLINTL